MARVLFIDAFFGLLVWRMERSHAKYVNYCTDTMMLMYMMVGTEHQKSWKFWKILNVNKGGGDF